MSYIGNPIVSTDFPVNYFSGNGSTTAFTLSIAPASVNSIDVQISGVSQSPQTYSVSGTTLTFSAAPPTGSSNIVVRHLGIAGIPNTPSAGSVVPSSIGTGYSLWNLSGSDVNYTAGNVGIGTASPSSKLDVSGSNAVIATFGNATTSCKIGTYLTNTVWGFSDKNVSNGIFGSGDYVYIASAGLERMRIDSSGNLLVGTTSTSAYTNGTVIQPNAWLSVGHASGTTGGTGYVLFGYNGSGIGSITQNGTTAVAYNTTSDYRLKTDVTSIKNALSTVEALNPVSFTWLDGRKDDGFIAHELQKVIPNCVTGEKDAVDEDGNPVYQQMDNSGVIPFLVKAIQEQQAIIEDLKTDLANTKLLLTDVSNKVAALEAK